MLPDDADNGGDQDHGPFCRDHLLHLHQTLAFALYQFSAQVKHNDNLLPLLRVRLALAGGLAQLHKRSLHPLNIFAVDGRIQGDRGKMHLLPVLARLAAS